MKIEKTILEQEFTLENIPEVVRNLMDAGVLDEHVCLMIGDLGAGKTTLVKAIVSKISSDVQVTSPTYSLINEYGTEDQIIYHMDLYRLNSLEEAQDIGVEEYFYNGICFIEWPQIIEDILPDKYYIIEIENLGNFTRCLKLKKVSNKAG